MMKYDFLIVGAGCFGATAACQLARAGHRVLVLDQRSHVGGNAYTELRDGIHVHQYGAHIFHTNSLKIWNFVNEFSGFSNYRHKVFATAQGRVFSFPINLLTMQQLWGVATPEQAAQKLAEVRQPIADPQTKEQWSLSQLGVELYELFIRGYSTKHWRKSPAELPSSIVRRLPFRLTYQNDYFDDQYQGIPLEGYTVLFERMLDQPGITVELGAPMMADWGRYAHRLIYSGRPDTLLNYQFGELPYLSLRFEHERRIGDYQGTAVMNYTDENIPYTRCLEHKHFGTRTVPHTWITHEYPVDWYRSADPYYPLVDAEVVQRFQRYRHAISQDSRIWLGGRLGSYRYLDMHQVVGEALQLTERLK
jgi:UDP-galactopyranose mutase